MVNLLGKRDKDEIRLQKNFFRAAKNLTWKAWQMYGACDNISIKNVTKHLNSLVRSDLEIV